MMNAKCDERFTYLHCPSSLRRGYLLRDSGKHDLTLPSKSIMLKSNSTRDNHLSLSSCTLIKKKNGE
jgi:hypothetical protein